MANQIYLPHKFIARDYQFPVINAMMDGFLNPDTGIKRAICVWHRRTGKDKTFLNLMIWQMMRVRGVYHYYFPTYAQGKKDLWDNIDAKNNMAFLDHFPKQIIKGKPHHQDMKIRLRNGSLFQVIGTDKADSVRGANPIGCVFSEYSLQDPSIWNEVIAPVLDENGGWALFNFTPKGPNHAYRLYNEVKDDPLWFTEILTVDDTDAISYEKIEQRRREGVDESTILQEYYCDFAAPMPGAYFAKEILAARKEGRIGDIAHYEHGNMVDTWWDLGGDATAIWFTQTKGEIKNVIDYYKSSREGLAHYVEIINQKRAEMGWMYRRHVWPHDGAHSVFSTGKTVSAAAREMGLHVEVLPRTPKKSDSIEAVRAIFPSCRFNEEKCKDGIDALANYRSKYDDKKLDYGVVPVHDWASHGADAFQAFAMGWTPGDKAVPLDVDRLPQHKKDALITRGLYNPETTEYDFYTQDTE